MGPSVVANHFNITTWRFSIGKLLGPSAVNENALRMPLPMMGFVLRRKQQDKTIANLCQHVCQTFRDDSPKNASEHRLDPVPPIPDDPNVTLFLMLGLDVSHGCPS